MSRTTAREIAMMLAFAQLSGGEDTYESALDKSGIAQTPAEADKEYIKLVLEGMSDKREQLDEIIADLAIDWSIGRMPRVDLSILRLAVYEMLYCNDIPQGVSINEAVELAKKYGGEKSSAFINGILGALSKKIKTGELTP